jgi:hypothetical protein
MIKCLLKFGFRFATIATFAMLPIANLSIAKEEPYFDLPKKDPKEQCEEVARVVRECKDYLQINGKMHKCKNIYIASFYFYPLTEMSYGGLMPYLIADEYGNLVASNIEQEMFLVKNLKSDKLFEDSGKNFDENEPNNIIRLLNKNCKIININFNN